MLLEDHLFEEISNVLPVRSRNGVVKVDIKRLKDAIHTTSYDIQVGEENWRAVSIHFLQESYPLDDVTLLQIAMTSDCQIDQMLKWELLYGLLMQRGLVIIKEGERIVGPHVGDDPRILCPGEVVFQRDFREDTTSYDAPNLEYFCLHRNQCRVPVYQLIGFILQELRRIVQAL